MAADTTAGWPPDGAPNRRRVAFATLVAAWAVWNLAVVETVAWGIVAAGFVAFVAAAGPLATSSIGSRVGAWFRAIGIVGRGLVIVGFAVMVWTATTRLEVPAVLPTSFGLGGILGTSAVVALEAVRSRTSVE
ncbi:hypothetical protein [Natronorubrum halophilum]|uniref:hypothetical protein n=1 Tax=Natronorubrum halophilum TaxID=1702106 RepID=UPI0010C18606|nr:hypothetical protein [Natronorubrum halophilum]